MESRFSNYEDNKCSWGYITLCDGCVNKIRESRSLSILWKQAKLDKKVDGFPAYVCERCGLKKGKSNE